MQSDDRRLTERRFLWLSAETCAALKLLSGGRRREEAAIMRAGIEAEVTRRQASAPVFDAATARVVAAAKARGVDVARILTDALEAEIYRDADRARIQSEKIPA